MGVLWCTARWEPGLQMSPITAKFGASIELLYDFSFSADTSSPALLDTRNHYFFKDTCLNATMVWATPCQSDVSNVNTWTYHTARGIVCITERSRGDFWSGTPGDSLNTFGFRVDNTKSIIFVTVITISCKTIRKKKRDNKKQVLQKEIVFFTTSYDNTYESWAKGP